MSARVPARPAGRGSPRSRLISSVVMLAVVAGGVVFYSIRNSGQLFDIGVLDHAHCAIGGIYPQQNQRTEMEAALGKQFAPMLQPLLNASGGEAISAHQCMVGDRSYIHIIVKKDGALLSVVATQRRDQEIFPRAFAGRTVDVAGIVLHESRRDGYSVAAFESGTWLGYVVSSLSEEQNGAVAGRLAPVMSEYMKS